METLRHVTEGKQHPAVEAFQNDRCGPRATRGLLEVCLNFMLYYVKMEIRVAVLVEAVHCSPKCSFCSCSLAFGFSAGGLLFPYYIGVISGLDDLGITASGKTNIAGASAGSLIAGCYHAGIPIKGIMEATMELVAMVRPVIRTCETLATSRLNNLHENHVHAHESRG